MSKKETIRVYELEHSLTIYGIRDNESNEFFLLSDLLNSGFAREDMFHGTGRLLDTIDKYTLYNEYMRVVPHIVAVSILTDRGIE